MRALFRPVSGARRGTRAPLLQIAAPAGQSILAGAGLGETPAFGYKRHFATQPGRSECQDLTSSPAVPPSGCFDRLEPAPDLRLLRIAPYFPTPFRRGIFLISSRMASARTPNDIMARFRIDLRGGAFRSVLGFTCEHWRRQPVRLPLIMAAVLLSTLADVLTPLYAGRLVDAVASGAATDAATWNAAMAAFSTLIGAGARRDRAAASRLHGASST